MASIRLKEGVFSKGDDPRSSTTSAYVHFDPITANLDHSIEQNLMSTHFCSAEAMGAYDHQVQAENISKEQNICLRALQSKVCKYIDITATVLVIALVWMMMAVPTIMYINTLVRLCDIAVSISYSTDQCIICAAISYRSSQIM